LFQCSDIHPDSRSRRALSRQEIIVERTTYLCRCRRRHLQWKIFSSSTHVLLNSNDVVNNRFGSQAVWVGTRFVCAKEAGAPKSHQQAIVESTYDETIRTLIYTGRPLRVLKNPYIMNWETERREEMQGLLDKGVLPVQQDLETLEKLEDENKSEKESNSSLEGRLAGLDIDDVERPYLMGEVAAAIRDVKPAKEIIDEMIKEAIEQLRLGSSFIDGAARL
jgi:NAD(P)H-dependent flavin oxidoreductase YrpB (nitropropane dioxygenase family)